MTLQQTRQHSSRRSKRLRELCRALCDGVGAMPVLTLIVLCIAAPVAAEEDEEESRLHDRPAFGAVAHLLVTAGEDGGDTGRLRLRAPTAEEAARLAREAADWEIVPKGLGGRPLLAAAGDETVETLADGTERARLPRRLLSWSTVAASFPERMAGPVRGRFVVDQGRLRGADPSGRLLVFSPDPVFAGSSLSHWDPSASPDLLMEPFVSPSLAFGELDATPALMEDLGWRTGGSQLRIVSLDPPGLGLRDPRPFAGAPGNPASTLGEARRRVFEALFELWETTLDSEVPIDVLISWRPLFCEPGIGAVLAGAGPTSFFRDGPGFPERHVWYPAALAESFAGFDLTGPPEEDGGDIVVLMNSSIDEGCLAEGTGYYYGLDGLESGSQVDAAAVVLHEMAHGLGMLSTVDAWSGELLNGTPGAYDLLLEDTESGRGWGEMNAAERAASAVRFRRLAWTGPAATAAAASILEPGEAHLEVATAAGIERIEIGRARFGPPLEPGLEGDLVCLRTESGGGESLDGCGPAVDPAAVAGSLALVDRSGCGLADKVASAQEAGARAVVVVESSASSASQLGGVDDDGALAIPAVSIGRRDGLRLQRAVCGASTLFLQKGRFEVTARFRSSEASGVGRAHEWTDQAGLFSFFDRDNPELVVKILDACGRPEDRAFWVYAAGLTDVELTLTVTDVGTGISAVYSSPGGRLFQPLADTETFNRCP